MSEKDGGPAKVEMSTEPVYRSEEELAAAFEAVNDDYTKFERVENPRSKRADLHAFLLLDELVPGSSDIVSAAEHDEIFIDVSLEDLAKVITAEQVLELTRCGVRITEYGCLGMFV